MTIGFYGDYEIWIYGIRDFDLWPLVFMDLDCCFFFNPKDPRLKFYVGVRNTDVSILLGLLCRFNVKLS